MNILLMKIGGRINTGTRKPTNGNAGENKLIVELFLKGGHNVTLCTKYVKGDDPETYFGSNKVSAVDLALIDDVNNIDMSKYDKLVVINGSKNFFGGQDGGICATYKVLNTFPKEVIFFYTDPLLTLSQVWNDKFDEARNPGWGTKWTESDLLITRKDITLLAASKGTDLTKKPFVAKGIFTDYKEIIEFEWQKAVIFGNSVHANPSEEKQIDLIYGGFYRGGARRSQMIEFMFDTDYNAAFFGKIEEHVFKLTKKEIASIKKYPSFKKELGDWDFWKKETNKAYATIVFAEDTYCDAIVTMRVYAAALSNVIVFIEDKYDSKHTIFPNDTFRGFNYVKDKEDLSRKMKIIKSFTTEQYNKMCKSQIKQLRNGTKDLFKDFNSALGLTFTELEVKESSDEFSDW